jgi:small subunit ribosomal protein S9
MMKGSGVHSIGRRKTSSARVYLRQGTGKILVNGKEFDSYFERENLRRIARSPLVLTETVGNFDILVNVKGGGQAGQAGAVKHAIARALDKENSERHISLKRAHMLTRDPRAVERKKFGRHKARKRPQFSKR